MKKGILRLLVLTVCMACILSAVCAGAYAITPFDPDEDVSLTVSFQVKKNGIPDVPVSVYRVADVNEDLEFTLCDGFTGYTGKINGWRNAAEWGASASQLADYAIDPKNKIYAVGKDKTSADGEVSFSNRMSPGLYLVVFGETKYNGLSYSAKPCLVCLPNTDDSDTWDYDVLIKAKVGAVPTPPPIPSPSPTPTPNPSPTPTPKPTPTPPPRLPQTGQLWWPVPVLLCAGLMIILVGIIIRRSNRSET